MLVTFLVIMLLQLSRLSWTLSLGFCIHTHHLNVLELLRLFLISFITHRIWRESQGQAGSFLVVWLCPKAEILLCCYVRLFVAFFWMWDWINDELSYWLWWAKDLPSSTVSVASELDPSHRWSQADQAISALLMSASGSPLHSQRSTFRSLAPLFAKWRFSVHPASLLSLSISLSTCSASVSQQLSEEEVHSFGHLPLAMIWWVRRQINSQNINRIFTSSHQPLVTGYSYSVTRGSVRCIWRRACRSDETAGSRR